MDTGACWVTVHETAKWSNTTQQLNSNCIAQGTLLQSCGDLNGKEIQKGGDICTHIDDSLQFVGQLVQSLSCVRLFAIPQTAAHQASLSITNSRSLLKLTSIESVMPSNHLILCHPLLLLPSIFPIIWGFSTKSALPIRWPKYWSFSFNISPSNEQPGLISFRMDWLDLLAVQGTLKYSPTPQFKNINFSALSFLYNPTLTSYMTTGKTIALTIQTFDGKVMSLLFNMLSRLVISFLSRSKHLLISWLQSPSAVILEPKK